MKKHFFQVDPQWASLFSANGLDHFDALWNAHIDLVDEPNRARGGWSEVGVLSLVVEGREERFYLKRQENFNCRTPRHPFRGIPVALREWQTIQWLGSRGIATLDVVCSARQCGASDRAILVTRALEGFLPLDTWLSQHPSGESHQKGLLALGRLIGRLHSAGMKHGCLYPKHVYFPEDETLGLRLIDLEKCKRIRSRDAGLRDLDTLLRHTPELDADDQQRVFAGYIETSPHSWTAMALSRAVEERVRAKSGATGG
ncbi:MAG: lipopolysaccharide kinase InaA family protein [Porticoccaceae bacterium]